MSKTPITDRINVAIAALNAMNTPDRVEVVRLSRATLTRYIHEDVPPPDNVMTGQSNIVADDEALCVFYENDSARRYAYTADLDTRDVSWREFTREEEQDRYAEGLEDAQPRGFSQRRIDMAEAILTIRDARAAIHAALLTEIGDAATADRLTTVVMRALEGERLT